MKKIIRLIGGLIIFVAILQPFSQLDINNIAFYTAQYRADYEKYEEKLIFENSSQIKLIIEDRTRTYILQKADEIGLDDCSVTVRTKKMDDGYPYPYEVYITYWGEERYVTELSRFIESELGVPAERQSWSKKNEE